MQKRWLLLLVLLAGCTLVAPGMKELAFSVEGTDKTIDGDVFQNGVFLGRTTNGVLLIQQENVTEGALIFAGIYQGKPFNVTFSISTDILSARTLRFALEQDRLDHLTLAFTAGENPLEGTVYLNGERVGTTIGGKVAIDATELEPGRVEIKGTYKGEPFEFRFTLKEPELQLNQMNFKVSEADIGELLFDAASLNRFVLEKEVHRLINVERAKANVPILKWNAQVAKVALAHSEDMSKSGYFAHKNPAGQQVGERLKASGFFYTVAAEDLSLFENLASSTNLSEKAVEGWMKSPGHRAPIVDPDHLFTDGGAGIACVEKTCYITYVFVANERSTQTNLQGGYLSFQYLYDPSFGFTEPVPVLIELNATSPITLYVVEGREAYDDILAGSEPSYVLKKEGVTEMSTTLTATPGMGVVLENGGGSAADISLFIDYYP